MEPTSYTDAYADGVAAHMAGIPLHRAPSHGRRSAWVRGWEAQDAEVKRATRDSDSRGKGGAR